MYVCMYVCVCMYVNVLCMCVRMHACIMYACRYVGIYVRNKLNITRRGNFKLPSDTSGELRTEFSTNLV